MAAVDRLSFLTVWNESLSSIRRELNLFFYPNDETIELYDIGKHRLFLKRTKYDNISLDDIYLGATLRICSRSITVLEYADDYTRTTMMKYCEKTCVIIKSDLLDRMGDLLKMFTMHDFKIINLKLVMLSQYHVSQLLDSSSEESLLVHGYSALIVQLLSKEAVSRLWELITSDKFDDELRQFNINKTDFKQGLYISRTYEKAKMDAEVLFAPKSDPNYLPPLVTYENSTCCVIKPHIVKEGKTGDVISAIQQHEFQITGVFMCSLALEAAENFHEIYKNVTPTYCDMIQELSSGPCVALEIRRNSSAKIVEEFRKIAGPPDPEIAKILRPNTLRAHFGRNKHQNAVHTTDLPMDALSEAQDYLYLHPVALLRHLHLQRFRICNSLKMKVVPHLRKRFNKNRFSKIFIVSNSHITDFPLEVTVDTKKLYNTVDTGVCYYN